MALTAVPAGRCCSVSLGVPPRSCADPCPQTPALAAVGNRGKQAVVFSLSWRSCCSPEIRMWFSVVGRTGPVVSFIRVLLCCGCRAHSEPHSAAASIRAC